MSDPRLLNVHDYPKGLPPGAMRIGRPGVWGNPFTVERHGRDRAIQLFRVYAENRLRRQPDWLKPLEGKSLACFCTPLACHGDVLLELLDR